MQLGGHDSSVGLMGMMNTDMADKLWAMVDKPAEASSRTVVFATIDIRSSKMTVVCTTD